MALSPTVVCNNVLRRAFDENISVTPMKLQKLLYFISCEYVKNTGIDLLSENFSVWQYGPVLVSVYDEFKSFHGSSITKYAKDAEGKSFAYNEITSPNLKTAIDRIWCIFKNKTGIELSQITHEDESGWSKAYKEGKTVISSNEMKEDDSYVKYLY